MSRRLKVLSVGSEILAKLVRETLLPCHRSCHSVAENYWQLCSLALKEAEEVSLAILEVAGSARELRQRAELIRRRWPHAQILLIGDSVDDLDDPLYDARVPCETEPPDLRVVIEILLRRRKQPSPPATPLFQRTG